MSDTKQDNEQSIDETMKELTALKHSATELKFDAAALSDEISELNSKLRVFRRTQSENYNRQKFLIHLLTPGNGE